MLLGIDVGGTFTDAVIIKDMEVVAQAKVPTQHDNILACILSAVDRVLKDLDYGEIKRVVISSTIVTNALTENRIKPVFLAVMAGPGMNVANKFPVEPYFVSGYIDHRGKVISGIDWSRYQQLLSMKGKGSCAVSGKFSVREPQNEYLLKDRLQKCGFERVFLGSELSGELNFIRRTNSAYYAAAVDELFRDFCGSVEQALEARKVYAPIHILKADGGTLPLKMALQQPVEAVFTGPAASVLGIEALLDISLNSISLDVGGTTTDIAFWENGLPLMSKKGAVINGYPTAVRSFHMCSIGIGGDSQITKNAEGYQIGPWRQGPAAAVGGAEPTLSDALIVAGYVNFGDRKKSEQAIGRFGENIMQEAKLIVKAAADKIVVAINNMLQEWSRQPVYKVNDIIKGTDFIPQQLVGVGGGAPGLVRAVSEQMGIPYNIPQGAMVANAIGAAVAKPTLSAGLRADTTDGYYIIPESGRKNALPKNFNKNAAKDILSSWLKEQAKQCGIAADEVELIAYEHFKTIHGYYDTGDIYSMRMQLKPGILHKVHGREVVL